MVINTKSPKNAPPDKTNIEADKFITKLRQDFPEFKFNRGQQDHYSPKDKTISFNVKQPLSDLQYGVLHELAHGLLGHDNYQTDFELLKLESEAWEKAAKIAKKYRISLSNDHIQNCLDTYREWLHRRSTCPNCGMHVLQQSTKTYKCFNCRKQWQVSSGRFVRPYRKSLDSVFDK